MDTQGAANKKVMLYADPYFILHESHPGKRFQSSQGLDSRFYTLGNTHLKFQPNKHTSLMSYCNLLLDKHA
jgi:hypothetical protein